MVDQHNNRATVAALLALTEYGKGFEVQNRNTDMSVQYEFLNTVRRMKVTSEAATTLHKRLLPGETREVGLRATGSGVAVIEVGYQYNLNVTSAWPSFVVNPFVTKVRCSFMNRAVNAQKFSQCFRLVTSSNTYNTQNKISVLEDMTIKYVGRSIFHII